MNALPIGPAMMAAPATPAQGSGTTDSSFQQQLDGSSAALSAGAPNKVNGDGTPHAATEMAAAPHDPVASEPSAAGPSPSDASATAGLTGEMTYAGTALDESEDATTTTAQTLAILLIAAQTVPATATPPMMPALLAQGETQVLQETAVSSQGGGSQAVLQVLDTLLTRTATAEALPGATPVPADQAAGTTSTTTGGSSTTFVQVAAALNTTTTTTPQTATANALPAASGQATATATVAPETTPPTATSQASRTPAPMVIAETAVEVISVTRRLPQTTATVPTPEQTGTNSSSSLFLHLDDLGHDMRTSLSSALNQQQTADGNTQGKATNAEEQASQGQTSLNPVEEPDIPSDMIDTAQPDTLFSSVLEAGTKAEATTASSSSPRPAGAFTVSDDHVLHQILERFALGRRIESGSITLRLHPAELGELRLDVQVQRATVQLQVTAQNPQVQEMLEQNMTRLREALAQHGFSLDRMEVTLSGNPQGELLQQDQDRGARYPASFAATVNTTDWQLPLEDAATAGTFLSTGSATGSLNIHI